MSKTILEKTRTKLIKSLADKGFTTVDDTNLSRDSSWILKCNVCEKDSSCKLASLLTLGNTDRKPCCKHCRTGDRGLHFFRKYGFDITTQYSENEYLVECNQCKLQYHYNGDLNSLFNCYCKLQFKSQERALMTQLQQEFPECKIQKGTGTYLDRKFEITMQNNGKTFLFCVDDLQHTANTDRNYDKGYVKRFLDEHDENVFLVRISKQDTLIPTSLNSLVHWMKNTEPPNLVLVDTCKKRRYKYLDLQDIEKYYIF